MSSLDATFKDLLGRIGEPDVLNPAKSDPVFYFVYPPEEMLELKRRLPRWMANLREAGLEAVRISLSDVLWGAVEASGRWDGWLEIEHEADASEINEAVLDVLRTGQAFTRKVADLIAEAPEGAIVLLTEAEALHPYFRTRTIESFLHDCIKAPTVIFYPGRRSGQYGLHFLGFYPVDGNYRSTLIGGI